MVVGSATVLYMLITPSLHPLPFTRDTMPSNMQMVGHAPSLYHSCQSHYFLPGYAALSRDLTRRLNGWSYARPTYLLMT